MYMLLISAILLLETHAKEIIIAISKEVWRQLFSLPFLEHLQCLSTELSTLHTFLNLILTKMEKRSE